MTDWRVTGAGAVVAAAVMTLVAAGAVSGGDRLAGSAAARGGGAHEGAPRKEYGYEQMPGGGSKAYNRAGSGGGGSGSRAAEQADDICRGTSRGGAHVDPACMPGQMSLKGASRDPQLIRAQLKRAGEYFRQSLQELNAGGSLAADPAGHSALEGYKLIRFAQHGIENRLARDKNPPPSLKQYIARIEEARKHNRMAMTALKQATQALGGPDVRLAMQQKNAMSQRTSSGKGKRRNDVGTISPEAEQRAQQKASELVASAMDHLQRTAVITQEVLAKLQ